MGFPFKNSPSSTPTKGKVIPFRGRNASPSSASNNAYVSGTKTQRGDSTAQQIKRGSTNNVRTLRRGLQSVPSNSVSAGGSSTAAVATKTGIVQKAASIGGKLAKAAKPAIAAIKAVTLAGAAKVLGIAGLLVAANAEGTADGTLPDWVKDVGESSAVTQPPEPTPYGYSLTYYSTNNRRWYYNIICQSYRVYESPPGAKYPWILERTNHNGYVGSINIDPSTLTATTLDYPDGQEPPPVDDPVVNSGQSRTSTSDPAYPTDADIIKPNSSSSASSSVGTTSGTSTQSDNLSTSSSSGQDSNWGIPRGVTPKAGQSNNPASVSPASKPSASPASVPTSSNSKGYLPNPSTIPKPLPEPERKPERDIDESSNDETVVTPPVISKTVGVRADGSVQTTTRREATESEMRDIQRNASEALKTVNTVNQQQQLNYDPSTGLGVSFTPVPSGEFILPGDFPNTVEETTRTPALPIGIPDVAPKTIPTAVPVIDNEPSDIPSKIPLAIPAPLTQTPTPECKGCNGKILSKLDGLNFGLQASELGMITQIHSTVHSTTHGLAKIQSFAETAWRVTKADKIMHGVSMAMTIHNGMMLSNNLAATVSEAANMALDALNIRDETDNPINIGGFVRDKLSEILTSIIGESAYTQLTARLASANRIYQASTNMLHITYDLFDSARSVAETTAENTGKIGNALRDAGAVYEDAYGEMVEKVNPHSQAMKRLEAFRGTMSGVTEGVETITQVSSEVVEIQQNWQELSESKDLWNTEVEQAIETARLEKDAAKTEAQINTEISEDDFSRLEPST